MTITPALGLLLSTVLCVACSGKRNIDSTISQKASPLQGQMASFGRVTLLPTDGVQVPTSDGFIEGLPQHSDPPPVALCEDPTSGVLTRSACPTTPPAVIECDAEGMECRYWLDEVAQADEERLATANGGGVGACAARFECVYGLWTHVGNDCEVPFELARLAGNSDCPNALPVADAPCAEETLACSLQCPFGEGSETLVTCVCGRWVMTHGGCAVD